jgi:hypothetical protein
VLDLLRGERFVDLGSEEVYASQLDEGLDYCSIRTIDRILASENEYAAKHDLLKAPFDATMTKNRVRRGRLMSSDIEI